MSVIYPTITNTGTITAGSGISLGTVNFANINQNTVYTTSIPTWQNMAGTISTGTYTLGNSNSGGVHFSGSDYNLSISATGEITWTGSLNRNAQRFIQAVESGINLKAAGSRALARNYRLALEKCLRKINTMDRETFILELEQEIAIRKSKEAWNTLTESEDEPEDE